MAAAKKHADSAKGSVEPKEEAKKPASAKALGGQEEKVEEAKEPVVISDVVTETIEKIEIIEEVTPEPESKTEKSPEDPLTDFKEKMIEEEESPAYNTGPKKNFMWPILFIFVIALLLLGGIFVYKQSMNKGADVNVVTLTPAPTVIPEPTKAVDLTKYPIEIQNGSGVGGEAGRQRVNLEAEGFTVASVGNADNSDYTKTIIQAKADVDQAFLDKLKSVLELSFVVGDSEELSSDADSDVIVILGSETN